MTSTSSKRNEWTSNKEVKKRVFRCIFLFKHFLFVHVSELEKHVVVCAIIGMVRRRKVKRFVNSIVVLNQRINGKSFEVLATI
jgi:hypothetical protein